MGWTCRIACNITFHEYLCENCSQRTVYLLTVPTLWEECMMFCFSGADLFGYLCWSTEQTLVKYKVCGCWRTVILCHTREVFISVKVGELRRFQERKHSMSPSLPIQVSWMKGTIRIINRQNKTKQTCHCVIGQNHKWKSINYNLIEMCPQNSTSIFMHNTAYAMLD